MAVYTQISAEQLALFLARYDVGTLISAKGIAEGVSNSNYLVETTAARFVLTLYERRIKDADLPFFIALMEHLAIAGMPVPRPIRDRSGQALQRLEGRAACLVHYLPGVSATMPTVAQCRAAGQALARMHLATQDFRHHRANGLGPDWWSSTAAELSGRFDTLAEGLDARVAGASSRIERDWPSSMPAGIIHADLFPDNVLMLGDQVTGLIDFYFACTGILAYDLAVLLVAWAFPADGSAPHESKWRAVIDGYCSVRRLLPDEERLLPLLCLAASLRFLLSRAQDLFHPADGALVMAKDPLPFARRLQYFSAQLDG